MKNVKVNSFGKGLVMDSLDINSLLAYIDEMRVLMSNTKKSLVFFTLQLATIL